MAFGPGKYDELCTEVREQAQALGAIVMVFGGKDGAGFSVQAPAELTQSLPQILRHVAAEIEKTADGATGEVKATPNGCFNLTNLKDLEYICEAAEAFFSKTGHLTWAERAVKYGAMLRVQIARLE
jgi:hypothetical protein